MNKKWNLTYLSLGLICILLAVLSKFPYRNYICSNQIHDFGLADSLPSFFIIPGTFFLILSKVKNRSIKILNGCTLFGLADERHQLFTNASFDDYDIAAAFIALTVGAFFYDLFEIRTKKEK